MTGTGITSPEMASVEMASAETASVETASAVLSVPAAGSDAAFEHFAGRLAFETDVSDVQADLAAGLLGQAFVLIDSRSREAWDQGHVPGAVHLPTREIASRAADGSLSELIPSGVPCVTYCWGPGCNGATRAALELARLGVAVKEMIGGFEYWVREGFAYETRWGLREPAADPLTAPADRTACGC
jgi:rhodanese-related sulfurtransferase